MEPSAIRRMAELQAHHWWFEGRRCIMRSLIQGLDLPEGASILEIGCGTGANLAMLQEFGDVTGVEPDDGARALIQAPGVELVDGRLPDGLAFAEKSFDLICLFDVLEHVDNDGDSLNNIRKLLKNDGYLLLVVPAFPWLWGAHDVAHHHKRRYRLQELAGKMRNAEYSVEYISYYNFMLFPLIAGVRLVKKWLGKDAPDDAMPPEWLNEVLLKLFASERFWIRRYLPLPVGVSLVAICR
ncbi:methyltransferase domain-containing protein [bacterium]|nr:methyltransferase domain-containing protein [bacterium]